MRAATKGQLEVFAVRLGTGFTWELRQFGGLILAKGTESHLLSTMLLRLGTRRDQSLLKSRGAKVEQCHKDGSSGSTTPSS